MRIILGLLLLGIAAAIILVPLVAIYGWLTTGIAVGASLLVTAIIYAGVCLLT